MGSSKRRQARRRAAASKAGPKSADTEVPMNAMNPFPICSVPSSFPARYRNVVDNLSSHVALHRAISCSALSNIACGDRQAASELIKSGLVPVVLPLLVDADSNVATHAAGLLRNLAVMDGDGFVVVARNTFDDLVTLVLSRGSTTPSPWHVQILALLACMTEHDLESAAIRNGAVWNLSSFLCGPVDAAVAVLEIYRNVVDDRPDLARMLLNSHLPTLRSLLSHESVIIVAHTTALFATLARLTSTPALLTEIAPHLAACASIDLSLAKKQLIHEAQRMKAEIHAELERQRAAHNNETIFQESIEGRLAPEAFDQAWQGLLDTFRIHAVAVQIAAETVANLICVDEDQPTWSLKEVVHLAGIHQLIPLLSDRIRTIVDNERFDSDDWNRVLDLLYGAMERCVEAMINLVLNEVATGLNVSDLAIEVIERECNRSEPRLSLLEVSGRLLSLSMGSRPRDLRPDQLEMITALATRSLSESIRQEFVAVLVRFGTGDAGRADLVADAVLSRVQDGCLRVFLEAANGLMEMFADDGVHQKTLARLNMLSVLSGIVSDERRWRAAAEDLAEEALETRDNLQAFIQYRSTCP